MSSAVSTVSSTTSSSIAKAATNESLSSTSSSTSRLGWTAGIGMGIGFVALLLCIAVLIWWLVKRRRKKRKVATGAGDAESFKHAGQETGVAEGIDGKAQLDDTQVVTSVHEMQGRRSDEDTKKSKPVYELDGSNGPALELPAGPLSNRHEAEGNQNIRPLGIVSPVSEQQPGGEDSEVSPVSIRT